MIGNTVMIELLNLPGPVPNNSPHNMGYLPNLVVAGIAPSVITAASAGVICRMPEFNRDFS